MNKPLHKWTGQECNREIRLLQETMPKLTKEVDKDRVRSRIAVLAQQASYANRNSFKPTKDD